MRGLSDAMSESTPASLSQSRPTLRWRCRITRCARVDLEGARDKGSVKGMRSHLYKPGSKQSRSAWRGGAYPLAADSSRTRLCAASVIHEATIVDVGSLQRESLKS